MGILEYCDKIKDDKIGRTCSTHDKERNANKTFISTAERKGLPQRPTSSLYWKIILKYNLQK
jgi:hypothetical protein